jgi:hypothetical protein
MVFVRDSVLYLQYRKQPDRKQSQNVPWKSHIQAPWLGTIGKLQASRTAPTTTVLISGNLLITVQYTHCTELVTE